MICTHCGTTNKEDAKFCRGCGAKIELPGDMSQKDTEPLEQVSGEKDEERVPKRRRSSVSDETIVFRADEKEDTANMEEEFEAIFEEPKKEEPKQEAKTETKEEPVQVAEQPIQQPQVQQPPVQQQEQAPVQQQEQTPQQNENVCPNCGAVNAPGTAFCGSCGTHIASGKNKRAKDPKQSSDKGKKIVELLKMSFKNPSEAARMAKADDSYWLGGLLIFLAKDFLIALVTAISSTNAMNSMLGGFGSTASELTSMTGFRGFILIFLLLAIGDGLMMVLFNAMAKPFGSKCKLVNLLGATAPSAVIHGLGAFLALLIMSAGAGGFIFGMLIYLVIMIWQFILFWKGFEIATEVPETKNIYAFLCGLATSTIAIAIVAMIISAIAAAMMVSSGYNQITNWDQF